AQAVSSATSQAYQVREQIVHFTLTKHLSVRGHQRPRFPPHGSHILSHERVVFAGQIDQLNGKILDASLNARNSFAVLKDDLDSAIPGSYVGIWRQDRRPEVFETALAADSR